MLAAATPRNTEDKFALIGGARRALSARFLPVSLGSDRSVAFISNIAHECWELLYANDLPSIDRHPALQQTGKRSWKMQS
jgi:hypothetical protein